MQLEPRLIDVDVPDDPQGVVLVLHGGAARRAAMAVSPTQLSVVRMIPIARRVARRGRGRLAVYRLLNSQRGWDTEHTPVDDAHWALDRIAEQLGRALPACLVGHSLGGRAALLAANHTAVRSVVALAPWVYPTDLPRGADDRRFLIVHGDGDRVARAERSAEVARALGRRADVGYVTIEGGKHAMLRHHAAFDGLAAEFAATTLLGEPAGDVLGRIEAGEAWVAV
ncbi:alpha/beta hydrolase [Patulibacter sp.]|uniref:alpha/beta hydrolase n=1 Tax=Patulibacter sp. TaxID=1912859 RepID=UPI002724C221|nr:alpha/beta hydrolase [Patulibacter sp.]MDO9410193.1 alpha/beta fold hydrolase [Patulibacter sp.]